MPIFKFIIDMRGCTFRMKHYCGNGHLERVRISSRTKCQIKSKQRHQPCSINTFLAHNPRNICKINMRGPAFQACHVILFSRHIQGITLCYCGHSASDNMLLWSFSIKHCVIVVIQHQALCYLCHSEWNEDHHEHQNRW